MDSKLKIIENTTGLDEEEARLALDLAEGDLEKALEMVDYVGRNFLILQIKFEVNKSGKIYGLANIIANGKTGDLLSLSGAVAYEREALKMNVNVENRAFMQSIDEIKDEYGSSYDSELTKGLYDDLNSANISNLFKSVKQDEFDFVEDSIKRSLDDIFEVKVELEMKSEVVTKTQLQNKTFLELEDHDGENEKKHEAEESEIESDDKESKLSIYLNCAPVISAVKGVKTQSLELGDQILARIVDKTEIGSYLADLISTKENRIAKGTIDTIHYSEDSKRYTIVLEFGPKIYGKLLADGEVKLALADKTLEEEEAEQSLAEDPAKNLNKLNLPWPLLVLLLVLVLVLIVLLTTLT